MLCSRGWQVRTDPSNPLVLASRRKREQQQAAVQQAQLRDQHIVAAALLQRCVRAHQAWQKLQQLKQEQQQEQQQRRVVVEQAAAEQELLRGMQQEQQQQQVEVADLTTSMQHCMEAAAKQECAMAACMASKHVEEPQAVHLQQTFITAVNLDEGQGSGVLECGLGQAVSSRTSDHRHGIASSSCSGDGGSGSSRMSAGGLQTHPGTNCSGLSTRSVCTPCLGEGQAEQHAVKVRQQRLQGKKPPGGRCRELTETPAAAAAEFCVKNDPGAVAAFGPSAGALRQPRHCTSEDVLPQGTGGALAAAQQLVQLLVRSTADFRTAGQYNTNSGGGRTWEDGQGDLGARGCRPVAAVWQRVEEVEGMEGSQRAELSLRAALAGSSHKEIRQAMEAVKRRLSTG